MSGAALQIMFVPNALLAVVFFLVTFHKVYQSI